MKNKLLFILVILLIPLASIIFFFNPGSLVPTAVLPEPKIEKEKIAKEIQFPVSSPASPLPQAITMITPPRKEKRAKPEAAVVKNMVKKEAEVASSPESAEPPVGIEITSPESRNNPSQSGSGNKINKKITPVQQEEMKTKGIMIY
jgi:hypothetical protein